MRVSCFCGAVYEGEKCPKCGEEPMGDHVPRLCKQCEQPLSVQDKAKGKPYLCPFCRFIDGILRTA